jgi:phosphate:Na+ symporter
MDAPDTILELVFWLLGGLALFIFGMRVMGDGLAAAVGSGMRSLLGRATRNRVVGLGLGTMVGTLIQSSASVVLYIGFINAGLMTLRQVIAPVLGANIGTTLSMQLISLKLSEYSLHAIFIGLLLNLVFKNGKLKNGGLALLGFGLLFLGMAVMSDAIRPYRETFEPWLAHINGGTTRGLITGTLAAMLITGVVQSSGAVIGMGFAMINAGAITDFEGMFPIILGANIGTCVTGLLGSIGTTIDARRAAVAHLLFNLIGSALGILAAPLFYRYIHYTSGDLVRQAANADTIKMVVVALMLLPLSPVLAKIATKMVPSKTAQPEPTFLDDQLLDRPEQAIFACLRELQRTARICAHSLHMAAEEFIQHDARRERLIKINEQSVNAIKVSLRDYIAKLTRHYLSKRQAILIEHIDRCMSDLERVGDHIENLSKIARRQRSITAARFVPDAIEDWLAIHKRVGKLLAKVIESLDPETANFQEIAREILELREEFNTTAMTVQHAHLQRLEDKAVTPIAGMIFNDYLSNFYRITKHVKGIALAEQQPQFWIKREKLGKRMSGEAPGYAVPKEINPHDYLDRLQSDDYR